MTTLNKIIIGAVAIVFLYLLWKLSRAKKALRDAPIDNKRRPFTLDEKGKVFEKTVLKHGKSQCWHCGKTEDLAIDHILPIEKGGNNSINNLQILCKTCNSSKRDRYEG